MLSRAIAIVEQIATTPHPLGVSELARRTGIPKTSTHRLLPVLAASGLVVHRRSGFVLGSVMRRLVELVHDRAGEDLRHLMVPYLVELYERTGDVVMLGVLDQDVVIVLETIYGHHSAATIPAVYQLPAHRSAMGILLLAHRQQVRSPRGADQLDSSPEGSPGGRRQLAQRIARARADGVAVCHGDYLPDITDVAFAVVDRNGVVAALGRMRPSGTPDAANTDVHRRIAIAASAALRSHPHRGPHHA